jgi:hypothetical protein
VIENAAANTWRNIRHELDRMHLVTLTTSTGQVAQRSATTPGQQTILRALDLPAPPGSSTSPSPTQQKSDEISAGQVSYDLRRLRTHGLIARTPRTHRYRITDTGLHHAALITHIHTRLL